MSEQQQKIQYTLVFDDGDMGEAQKDFIEGTEALAAACKSENSADDKQLMEKVCAPANIRAAYARVRRNKGAPGIDGMTVGSLPAYLCERRSENVSNAPL